MQARGSKQIAILETPAALAQDAARRFIQHGKRAIEQRGRFIVALSGGTTPRAMNLLLSAESVSLGLDWRKVHVLWGDERFVPLSHPDSTYLMTRDSLLANVPIPPENVYPVPTEGVLLDEAATLYERTIITLCGQEPALDLVVLGMGPDAHTASLFPHNAALAEPLDRLVVAVRDAPKPPPQRVSFTFGLINRATHVLVLVAGADKSSALSNVLEGPTNVGSLPAQGLNPQTGVITWLVDVAAASALQTKRGDGGHSR
jgi:6-phosphogluconolactonase